MSQTVASPALLKLGKSQNLKKLSTSSRAISAVLHTIGLASFATSYNYLRENPNPINTSYGWHFQYLTIIGLTLCTLTFTTGLVADTLSSAPLYRLKTLLSTASLPLAALISSLYWGIRLIDPALVVPPELELPLPTDLGFHFVPTLVLLLDFLFLSPAWTINYVKAFLLSMSIAFAYWLWIELCYTHNNFYPYPLLELLSTEGRVALFTGSAVAMAGMTGALKGLWGLVNGVEVAEA